MTDRLLPEAIRGAWYSLPDEPREVDEALESDGEILVFRLDETFERYQIDGDRQLEEDERAEYTFDGDFLILRGSSTETFRIEAVAPWKWEAEKKSEDRRLLRGTYGADDPVGLDEERVAEIDRLPGRVYVKSDLDGPPSATIGTFVHEDGEGDEVKIGAVCAEYDGDDVRWIAATPFAEGIDDDTWRSIVEDAYLDIYLDDPPTSGGASFRLVDGSPEPREMSLD